MEALAEQGGVSVAASGALQERDTLPDADAAFRAALDNVAHESLRVLTLWMSVIWFLLLPVPILTSPAHAIPLTLLQAVDVLVLVSVRLALVRGRIQRRRAQVVLAAILAVPVLDILIRGLIEYTSDRLVFLGLTIIGSGLFCLSAGWLAVLLAFAIATGGIVIAQAPPGEVSFVQSILPLFAAVGIAIVARMTRANAVWHVEQVRRQDVQHLKEARRNEAKFRGIVNGIHDVFYRTDLAGIVQMVSPSVRRFGYRPEDIIGTDVLRFYADPGQRDALVRQVMEKGFVVDYELALRQRDGAVRIAAASVSLLLDENGQAVGFEGLLHDISDRKMEETRKLQEARETAALARAGRELIGSHDVQTLLQRLCRLTTEVFACDVSHTVMIENEEAVVAAGYGETAEERESLRALRVPCAMLRDFLARLDREGVVQFVTSQTDERALASVALQYGLSLVLYFPLRRGAEIAGFQSVGCRGREEPFAAEEEHIARGIAHLASLAIENARLFEELQRANRLKSDFVATMSHELRTPLNVVMGYNSLLLDGEFGPLSAEQMRILQRIDRNARELSDLINATLDLGRLEEGTLPVDVEEFDVSALLAELKTEAEGLRKKEGVHFTLEMDSQLPSVRTDRIKLKVVLKNLLSNAFKFTDKGSVALAARASEDGVQFVVADTGSGIAPGVLPFIFEAFRQGDSSTTRAHGGVGLGLYIVRRLLEMLKGTIAVETQVDQGSTFRVWVPRDAWARPNG